MSATYEESSLDDLLATEFPESEAVEAEPAVEAVEAPASSEVAESVPRKRVRQQPAAEQEKPPEPPLQAETASEIQTIAAIPTGPITLSTGTQVELEPLKTRQLLRLLKIVTRGAGPMLMEYPLDLQDEEGLVVRLTALVAMSLPEAEDEAIDFIKSMCRPVGVEESRDRAAQTRNAARYEALNDELSNPEYDDTLLIITAIVAREAPDLRGLGKRIGTLWTVARQAGQIPKS